MATNKKSKTPLEKANEYYALGVGFLQQKEFATAADNFEKAAKSLIRCSNTGTNVEWMAISPVYKKAAIARKNAGQPVLAAADYMLAAEYAPYRTDMCRLAVRAVRLLEGAGLQTQAEEVVNTYGLYKKRSTVTYKALSISGAPTVPMAAAKTIAADVKRSMSSNGLTALEAARAGIGVLRGMRQAAPSSQVH